MRPPLPALAVHQAMRWAADERAAVKHQHAIYRPPGLECHDRTPRRHFLRAGRTGQQGLGGAIEAASPNRFNTCVLLLLRNVRDLHAAMGRGVMRTDILG
jgi:hypothetical protein